jgi:hypothetical protein
LWVTIVADFTAFDLVQILNTLTYNLFNIIWKKYKTLYMHFYTQSKSMIFSKIKECMWKRKSPLLLISFTFLCYLMLHFFIYKTSQNEKKEGVDTNKHDALKIKRDRMHSQHISIGI